MNNKIIRTARLIASYLAHDPFSHTPVCLEVAESIFQLALLCKRVKIPITLKPSQNMPDASETESLVAADALCTAAAWHVLVSKSASHGAKPPADAGAILNEIDDLLRLLGYYEPFEDQNGDIDLGYLGQVNPKSPFSLGEMSRKGLRLAEVLGADLIGPVAGSA